MNLVFHMKQYSLFLEHRNNFITLSCKFIIVNITTFRIRLTKNSSLIYAGILWYSRLGIPSRKVSASFLTVHVINYEHINNSLTIGTSRLLKLYPTITCS